VGRPLGQKAQQNLGLLEYYDNYEYDYCISFVVCVCVCVF